MLGASFQSTPQHDRDRVCLCLRAVHVHMHRGASLGPVSQVSSDWQRCVDPVVRVLDHGDPHGRFLLRGVHPADGLPVTQTCRWRADNIQNVFSRSCLMNEKKTYSPARVKLKTGRLPIESQFKCNVVMAPPLYPAAQMNR